MGALTVGAPLPEALREATVRDGAGERVTIGALVEGRITALVFLRHFGCVGCNKHVSDIAPRIPELDSFGIRVVFVGNGEPEHIDGFRARHQLDPAQALIVSDPELGSYRAAGLHRAVLGTVGARALWAQLRAFGAGYRQYAGDGDALQQGGALVVDARGIVAMVHRSEFIADNADPSDLVEAALKLLLVGSPAAQRGIV